MSSNSSTMERQSHNRRSSLWVKGGYFDYQTVFILGVIVLIGFLMVYSASSYKGVLLTGDSAYFVKRQAAFGVVAFVGMIFLSRLNHYKYRNLSQIAMIGSIALCFIVMIMGEATNGAVRWISIGPVRFQPSEIAKIAIIIYMAHVCEVQSKRLDTIKGIFQMIALPLVCIVLIALENLSTAIVCFAIVVVILFVASPKIKNLVILGILGIMAGLAAIFLVGYRGDRIDAWLHPETSESGFQTMQSLYAIGTGGLFGRGLGQSIQKMGFLPEAHNDMIFSIICEELGLFGAIGIIILFVMLLYRMKYIADHTQDSFGGFMVTGVMTHIAVQLIINIGVVTNTIPPTGVTLPFISYGGTSLVFALLEMSLVLSVSRKIKPI